jgi:glycosyltransferase involved in cell wall biosynthesis
MNGKTLRVLQIGWPDVSGPSKTGSARYTVELLWRLSKRYIIYYERVCGLKSYFKSPIIFAKYRPHDVDIVHVLGSALPHSLIGVFLSRLLGRPLVVTLFAYRFDELRALNKSIIRNVFLLFLERFAMDVAVVVIVTSEWQKRRLPAAIRGRTVVVYPGCNMPEGARSVVDRDDRVVSITGSLSVHDRIRRKGVDVIAEIAELTPELTFHIVGGSIGQFDNNGRRIPTNLKFHGFMSDRRVQKFLSEAKFILAPGRHEAFCISVLEGMRCGCIGIVSEFCGIQDVVRTCGLVLPLRANVFSRSMIQLLEMGEEADRLRVKGQEVSQRFTWEKAADALGRIYETLSDAEPHSRLHAKR